MLTIRPPLLPPSDPKHLAACEVAIEPSVQAVIDAAVEAGWQPDVVAAALVDLADAYVALCEAGGGGAVAEAQEAPSP